MGTWSAYLAFRTPGDGRSLFPWRESDPVAVAGWTYFSDRADHYGQFEAALKDIPGPALLSVVCDSDFAEVKGHLDGTRQWTAYINQPIATQLDLPTPDLPPAEDEGLLDRITVWAMAAGSPPVDRDKLRTALSTDYVFADDGLLALEQVLGVVLPEIRPFGSDQRTDYDVIVRAPVALTDEAIDRLAEAVQGEADPADPDERGHWIKFFVPKTHEPDVALLALSAVLRTLELPPATEVFWDGHDEWVPLPELQRILSSAEGPGTEGPSA